MSRTLLMSVVLLLTGIAQAEYKHVDLAVFGMD
jgi:hypothetical protein